MERFTTTGTGGMGVTSPTTVLKVTSSGPTTSSGTPNYHTGTISSGTWVYGMETRPPNTAIGFYHQNPNIVSFNAPINFTQATSKQIMQNKVAVFKVTRDKDERITNAEFIKELWVETKNGQSVDFQVARDKDLADYEMSDLSIRTIYTVTF
jgi:hypothetical protein